MLLWTLRRKYVYWHNYIWLLFWKNLVLIANCISRPAFKGLLFLLIQCPCLVQSGPVCRQTPSLYVATRPEHSKPRVCGLYSRIGEHQIPLPAKKEQRARGRIFALCRYFFCPLRCTVVIFDCNFQTRIDFSSFFHGSAVAKPRCSYFGYKLIDSLY